MADKFAVGEIAIMVCKDLPELLGIEVEIIEPRKDVIVETNGSRYTIFAYVVHNPCIQYPPGMVGLAVTEPGLKKLPPKDTVTSWEALKDIYTPAGLGQKIKETDKA